MMDNLPDIFAQLPFWLQVVIAILVALATIGFPLSKIGSWIAGWPMLKLWPHREGWSGSCNLNPRTCLDPVNAWTGGKANRWSQMREMQLNDHFQLHIKKARMISRIKLRTEGVRYPKKYILEIRKNDDEEWEKIGEYGTLDVALEPSRKIVEIKWSITKPRMESWKDRPDIPPAWAIYDIELTEARLFGRWWRKVITES